MEAPLPERILQLNTKELTEEIFQIEAAMALLDARRSALVHRVVGLASRDPTAPKILHFPGRIRVRRTPRESADEWPPGLGVEVPGTEP